MNQEFLDIEFLIFALNILISYFVYVIIKKMGVMHLAKIQKIFQ